MVFDDTIVALATATGGALSVVRLSGEKSFEIVNLFFSKKIIKPRNAYFGSIRYNNKLVDQVVIIGYENGKSFTGEECVEISCHGSKWVTNEILRICIDCGARMANAGEFTQRAFLNGKMDLSQAEAVGDLIAASSRAAAEIALTQIRGGYSKELSIMRAKLLNIKSLLELELDFGEEDVQFASRDDLKILLTELKERCSKLTNSFALGNVLKNGIPVAIVGKPNVGKSTLLNELVGEQRAIVSDIAGTTRDYIEELVNIEGVEFRFVDTAGIRNTDDKIEALGVERSIERIKTAKIILQLVDNQSFEKIKVQENQTLVVVNNKADKINVKGCDIAISAKLGTGVDMLKKRMIEITGVNQYHENAIVVSNTRHYEALNGVIAAVNEALVGTDNGLSVDLLAANLTHALNNIGEITGEITTNEVLANIFKNFCIGK